MKEVTLTLSAQFYQIVVQALQEIPWKVANPVLQDIDAQVRAALGKAEQSRADSLGSSDSKQQ